MAGYFVIAILFGMLANAFFAGIETGAISINRMRLRHHVEQGDRWAAILQDFLSHPDELLATTLIGTNLSMILASVLAASLGLRLFGAWGQGIFDAGLTVLVLVFCEYLPKAWFQSQPMERCKPFAGILLTSCKALRPLTVSINWITQWFLPAVHAPPQEARYPFVTRDELKVLAQEGEEHGVLSAKQRIMIHRVFELGNKTAAQVMVPRQKIVFVTTQMTVQEFFHSSRQANFTRLPVYDETQKKFVGTVNLFDPLVNPNPDVNAKITDHMRPPQFVRHDAPLTEILPLMRLSRQPMCLVTNTASEVIGLVTTQDIVAEIVGKL